MKILLVLNLIPYEPKYLNKWYLYDNSVLIYLVIINKINIEKKF